MNANAIIHNDMNMKTIFVAMTISLPILYSQNAGAEAKKPAKKTGCTYSFTTIKANPITSVKNQYLSSTCWCYSALSFLESEDMRINGIKDTTAFPDFSEMFVIGRSYRDRAVKYVRLDGKLNFGPGSEFDDVMHVVKDYGIVPQDIQPGLKYTHKFTAPIFMDHKVSKFAKEANRYNKKRLSDSAWIHGVDKVMAPYIGDCPDTFSVAGKLFTPSSYRDGLGIKPENYVTLTSFAHHPFHSWFALEIPDNWRWDESYNITLDELISVLDTAIMKGYTVGWGADVSEKGFKMHDGVAVLPEGTEVSQASRQKEFDNKSTTDDHGMQIFGIAADRDGKKYYMVKNSWGKVGPYKGIWYVSEDYVRMKTIDIMVNKEVMGKSFPSFWVSAVK